MLATLIITTMVCALLPLCSTRAFISASVMARKQNMLLLPTIEHLTWTVFFRARVFHLDVMSQLLGCLVSNLHDIVCNMYYFKH